LHDVAVIALYRVDHDAQGRVDDCAGLFGIEIAHQLGGAFDVGEQRRHRLAFPLRPILISARCCRDDGCVSRYFRKL
jgi:hypothetical protein